MSERPSCPLCHKRRPERFCPAVGEKICAICCGTERERTLDCPADCAYLIKAHRYEQEHRQPPAAADIPFGDTEISRATIYEQEPLVSGLAQALLKFADEQRFLTDLGRAGRRHGARRDLSHAGFRHLLRKAARGRRCRPRSTPPWPSSSRSTRSRPRPRRLPLPRIPRSLPCWCIWRACAALPPTAARARACSCNCCAPELPRRRNKPAEASRIIMP